MFNYMFKCTAGYKGVISLMECHYVRLCNTILFKGTVQLLSLGDLLDFLGWNCKSERGVLD